MTSLERAERLALWIAVALGLLGFAGGLGQRVLPPLPAAAAWPLQALVIGSGLLAARLARRRAAEIERRRWAALEEPLLTSGEREWAHREAERARRASGFAFLLAPLMLGYFLAYQFPEGAAPLARALAGTPLLGFVLGLLWERRAGPD
ncbi:MAG: hypothetical protein M5U13_05510 [Thermoanaerobaculia bacterium]|nr:hypothetical protein [Thermoanaerobaculia bacterium]